MDHQAIIDTYEAAGCLLRDAVHGLSSDELIAHPVPGTWSIAQIIHHIVDADLITTDRMKRIIAQDNPLLFGFDESRFASQLHYEEQSLEDAITIFELNRRQFARVLRKLAPEAFDRHGVHNERGIVKLGELCQGITRHVHHHLAFVAKKRSLLGK